MKSINLKPNGVITTLCAALLLSLSFGALAQDASDGANRDRARDFGQFHAAIKGQIVMKKRVYYTGEELEIAVVFRRGAKLITEGLADAYVVAFAPGTDLAPAVLEVSDIASENRRRLFRVDALDLSEFPAGRYQLGLIATTPGGDPLEVVDWYRKFLGLLDVAALLITDEAIDMDSDGDGMVDNDQDGDGISDDDDNDTNTDSDSGNDTGNTASN